MWWTACYQQRRALCRCPWQETKSPRGYGGGSVSIWKGKDPWRLGASLAFTAAFGFLLLTRNNFTELQWQTGTLCNHRGQEGQEGTPRWLHNTSGRGLKHEHAPTHRGSCWHLEGGGPCRGHRMAARQHRAGQPQMPVGLY